VRAFAIDTQGTMYMNNDGDTIDGALTDTVILR